ncbi:MAG: sulfatase-like hydrolase/transferase [Caldilineaceae bacterium]|nr:sulfatase-like hydrolase/transferase [Caldilineaceae bacterium]
MPTQPNILLLFSDEHSFRFMGHRPAAAGGEPVHTPNFDRLAAQSTVFNNAYCQMPLCTPSRICLLAGREVLHCGAWDNRTVFPPDVPSMPGVLAAAGYTTCLVGKMHFGGNRQFNGFQHRPYGDLTGNAGHQQDPLFAADGSSTPSRTRDAGVTEIPESKLQENVVAAETLAFLREHRHARPDTPWFLCASFSRPHFPLTAPRRFIDMYDPDSVTEPKVPAAGDAYDHPMSVGMREGFQVARIDHNEMMRARAAYFACVSHLDEIIGDLLLRLEHAGLLENTIIVYTTDHGEMAGEHGVWWKNGWYEACTHIPMLISTPAQRRGQQAARSVDTPVALIDLFPTFCGAAGVKPPAGLDGADLSPVILGDERAPDRPIFIDNLIPRWGEGTEFRAIRWRDYKYVAFRQAPPLLFNLANDPDEQVNLAAANKRGDLNEEDKAALAHLQSVASDSLNFEEAAQTRQRSSAELQDAHPSIAVGTLGNQYHMPNGTIVEADDTLYRPDVVTDDPASLFADWPG